MSAPSYTEPVTPDRVNGHPCFHPEHEEDLGLHETLTRFEQPELDQLRADLSAGEPVSR